MAFFSLSRWLRGQRGQTRTTLRNSQPRNDKRFRLGFETLEDRALPSFGVITNAEPTPWNDPNYLVSAEALPSPNATALFIDAELNPSFAQTPTNPTGSFYITLPTDIPGNMVFLGQAANDGDVSVPASDATPVDDGANTVLFTPNPGDATYGTGPYNFVVQSDAANGAFYAVHIREAGLPTQLTDIMTVAQPQAVTLSNGTVTLTDTATLSSPNENNLPVQGSITWTLTDNGNLVYTSPATPVDTNLGTGSAGNGFGDYSTSYTLPTDGSGVTGTYVWSASFTSTNSNYFSASDDGVNETTTVSPASPGIMTQASPTGGITLDGNGAPTISDTITMTGAYFPTGNIIVTLSGPGGQSYSYTQPAANGSFTESQQLPTTGTVAGTWTWSAVYAGDANNGSAVDQGGTAEQVGVTAASPTITTTSNPTGTVTLTGTTITVTDSAVVAGGYNETGNLIFTLSGPGGYSNSQSIPLAGNNTYSATTTLPATALVGTYTWTVTFAGDANNKSAADQGGTSEQFTLQAASLVGRGNSATMGFWANRNGRALLSSYTTSAIGNWLATTYPNLFGNLSGATGSQVYTYFVQLKGAGGLTDSTMTDALTTALSVYVTTSGLGWNSTAASFGFMQGPGGAGLGSLYFNIGNNGASFGVADNTLLTVNQILAYYNSHTVRTGGTLTTLPTWVVYGGSTSLLNGANVVIDGINQKGDIV
jgi:hypothetical protein